MEKRVVGHHSEAFIGIDTSKLSNAVAIAECGRNGEVRYLGEIPNTAAAMRNLVAKLAAKVPFYAVIHAAKRSRVEVWRRRGRRGIRKAMARASPANGD